jgi:hypothetical protein
MNNKVRSVRPFIGAKDYDLSRSFYRHLGFEEFVVSDGMSFFKIDQFGFYLQNAYVKDWIDNSMIFMEVEDVDQFREELFSLDLTGKYTGVRLTPVKQFDWGRECFMHDPSGILWHFGQFNTR